MKFKTCCIVCFSITLISIVLYFFSHDNLIWSKYILLTVLSIFVMSIGWQIIRFIPFTYRYIYFQINGEKVIRNFFKKHGISISPNPPLNLGLGKGMVLNNDEPMFDVNEYDIVINDVRFWNRVIYDGNMGWGQSYGAGWWEVRSGEHFAEIFGRVRKIEDRTINMHKWYHLYYGPRLIPYAFLLELIPNYQSPFLSKLVAKKHYNFEPEFFQKFLDPWMQYSCGVWDHGAKNNDEAQIMKLELLAKKLKLKPGMRVLDIGCGWATTMKYFAKNYGCKCVGITIADNQLKFGRKMNEGLDVKIILSDYRKFKPKEKFDAIYSIEGVDNYATFFKCISSWLKEDAVCCCQVIGSMSTTKCRSYVWIEKYMFPQGQIPSNTHLTKAIEESKMIIEDWQNIGVNYVGTLLSWNEKLVLMKDEHILKYGMESYKNWQFYFLSCAAEFKGRRVHDWQIVVSKNGLKAGYKTVR